ncbi:MAG: hypothetical protein M1830_004239 [Pleopsidium flavum]|nr:MAG: hypothetical protein M1830_004239 [Pleopsidium flavum]
MRSSTLVSALFIAGALSSPILQKRDYVTEVEVVTVTDYITQVFVAATAAATTSAAASVIQYYQAPASSSQAPAPSSKAPASSSQAPASSSQAPASAPSSSSSAAPSPSPVAESTGTDYNSLALHHHNIHRTNHSADALTWDDNLASYAQQVASSCVYAHNNKAGGGGYGQNIAAGAKPDHIGGVITGQFYNDEMELFQDYGQATPDMSNFEGWGHFSQIVWKDTKSVGCYTQACPGGLANVGSKTPKFFTVCNYSPPGNFAGDYTKVGKPLGHSYVDAPVF